MIALLRGAARWLARHIIIFLLVVLALVAASKIYEAYRNVPELTRRVAQLELQQDQLTTQAASQLAGARARADALGRLERPLLQQRLQQVRDSISVLDSKRLSHTGFAMEVVRGETDAIARDLGAAFRLQLLRREEAAILARIDMLDQQERVGAFAGYIRGLNAREAALERNIAEIQRRHPILSRGESVPILQHLQGPWQELSAARAELNTVRTRREQAVQSKAAADRQLPQSSAAYRGASDMLRNAVPPTQALRSEIEAGRQELSRNWANRGWLAVRPMLGWALWIVLLVIFVPPAVKAFWYFLIAPLAARMPPIVIRPDLAGEPIWRGHGGADEGSGVSRRIVVSAGEELIIRPEYLQSSMNRGRIGSVLVLNRAIPLGSLAVGLVGLTRIRTDNDEAVTISAAHDAFDEVGALSIPAGAGLVLKPRHLIGVLQHIEHPVHIDRVWKIGHLSAWLTLQLRFLVFEGPATLLVKGARGVALEPAAAGRRISGDATMGWSTGLRYSVRRSETFLAYLAGKQALYNDSFEGDRGKFLYEEMPGSRAKGGLFGRGLEGLGDGLLKVIGL
jgi:hypothetical protein